MLVFVFRPNPYHYLNAISKALEEYQYKIKKIVIVIINDPLVGYSSNFNNEVKTLQEYASKLADNIYVNVHKTEEKFIAEETAKGWKINYFPKFENWHTLFFYENSII